MRSILVNIMNKNTVETVFNKRNFGVSPEPPGIRSGGGCCGSREGGAL